MCGKKAEDGRLSNCNKSTYHPKFVQGQKTGKKTESREKTRERRKRKCGAWQGKIEHPGAKMEEEGSWTGYTKGHVEKNSRSGSRKDNFGVPAQGKEVAHAKN